VDVFHLDSSDIYRRWLRCPDGIPRAPTTRGIERGVYLKKK
jgi:hypothetical protein